METLLIMAQVTTGELSGLVTVFCGCGFAILGYCIKHWIDRIDKKLSNICANQTKCQIELPQKYVMKTECEKDMAMHDASLIRLAGKLNGGRELHT